MIIKTSEMDLFCSQFLMSVFDPAITEFNNWVVEEVLPKHKKLTGKGGFTRVGKIYPFPVPDEIYPNLHPDLCEEFDYRYDQLRQMEELEGNYYEYMLRGAVSNSGSLSDFYVLLPEVMHETLRGILRPANDVPTSVTSEQLCEFREQHATAIQMFKKRKTLQSIGVNKGSIV